ncbi:MAG TPA: hypothetical protein VKN62_04735 [Pelovirga sp.]|nr:hypothetical protein [Pelovirga sp.]
MSRWFLMLLCALLLSGCALLPPEEKELPPVLPESTAVKQQEADRYLDDYLAGGGSVALDQYLAALPESRQREALRRLAHELRLCRAEYGDLKAILETKNRIVVDLEDQNQHLLETIEQLKSLLIQLEQRVH